MCSFLSICMEINIWVPLANLYKILNSIMAADYTIVFFFFIGNNFFWLKFNRLICIWSAIENQIMSIHWAYFMYLPITLLIWSLQEKWLESTSKRQRFLFQNKDFIELLFLGNRQGFYLKYPFLFFFGYRLGF